MSSCKHPAGQINSKLLVKSNLWSWAVVAQVIGVSISLTISLDFTFYILAICLIKLEFSPCFDLGILYETRLFVFNTTFMWHISTMAFIFNITFDICCKANRRPPVTVGFTLNWISFDTNVGFLAWLFVNSNYAAFIWNKYDEFEAFCKIYEAVPGQFHPPTIQPKMAKLRKIQPISVGWIVLELKCTNRQLVELSWLKLSVGWNDRPPNKACYTVL